jgi:hypothetical protein
MSRQRRRHTSSQTVEPDAPQEIIDAAIERDLGLVELTPEDYIWDGSSLILDDDELAVLTDPQARLDYYREQYPNHVHDEAAARLQSWLTQLPPGSAFDGTSGYAVLQHRTPS